MNECKYCSEDKSMAVLASRGDEVKVTDPRGFVIAMSVMDKEKPIIKSFFWGVGSDSEFGSALNVDISYCPFCGRRLK